MLCFVTILSIFCLVQNTFGQALSFNNGFGLNRVGLGNALGSNRLLGTAGNCAGNNLASANLASNNFAANNFAAANFAGANLANYQLNNNLALNGLATNNGLVGPLAGMPNTANVAYGDVAVIGELPVGGNTAVTGNVPVIGYVSFEGTVPAGGLVSVASNNNCGCNQLY